MALGKARLLACIAVAATVVAACVLLLLARRRPGKPGKRAPFVPPEKKYPFTASWRKDPCLKGKFHPDFPDDVEALFYDYSSFSEDPVIEKMWVRLTKTLAPGAWQGALLNQPSVLKSVKQNDAVTVRMTFGATCPVFLPPEAREDRKEWASCCTDCGSDVLFYSPEMLQKKAFPDVPEGGTVLSMTARCPLCGGTMVVSRWDTAAEGFPAKPPDVLASPLYK